MYTLIFYHKKEEVLLEKLGNHNQKTGKGGQNLVVFGRLFK